MNPAPGGGQTCADAGHRAQPAHAAERAVVNLGPSLGSREVVISGALAAVVEFQDTYDGGSLGNVNIKLLPGRQDAADVVGPAAVERRDRRPGDPLGRQLARVARPPGRRPRGAAVLRRRPRGRPGLRRLDDERRRGRGVGGRAGRARATRRSSTARPTTSAPGPGSGLPGYPVVTAGGAPERRLPPGAPRRRRADAHPGRAASPATTTGSGRTARRSPRARRPAA